jgi:hypothetical protein
MGEKLLYKTHLKRAVEEYPRRDRFRRAHDAHLPGRLVRHGGVLKHAADVENGQPAGVSISPSYFVMIVERGAGFLGRCRVRSNGDEERARRRQSAGF